MKHQNRRAIKQSAPATYINGNTILFDGKNLALKQGTGIATYTKSLFKLSRELGHKGDFICDRNIAHSNSGLLNEVSFLDNEPDLSRRKKFCAYTIQMLASLRGVTPKRMTVNAIVERSDLRNRFPDADTFWNSPLLFRYAPYRFAMTGAFSAVRNVMKAELAHWTYPMPVRLRGATNVYTIHDLVPLKLPHTTLDNKRLFYRMVREIGRTADLILTVSETSRQDIISILGADEDRVVNTYQSVSIPEPLLRKDPDRIGRSLMNIHKLDFGQYMLFYGAIEPKKNIKRLVRAYLQSDIDIPLVIVGKDGWLLDPETHNLVPPIEPHGLRPAGSRLPGKRVQRIGYVDFGELIDLIRGARFVAFPSIYEGFGLPILEAMICGRPVLTGGSGATGEIGGDAVLKVDPYDIDSISAGMLALHRDETLRAELCAKGTVRAAMFSEAMHRDRLAAVYDRLL